MAIMTEKVNIMQLVTLICIISGAVYLASIHCISGDAVVGILSGAMSAAFLNERYRSRTNGEVAKLFIKNGQPQS